MCPTSGPVRFKVAHRPQEFEQIFQLGYETFVEEIPQHQINVERRHVDRFHDQNQYIIAVDNHLVVGMIAIRGERPFSARLEAGNVDPHLPASRRPCELRLLAVRPSHRKGFVFRGLVELMVREGRARGYDLALISGTLRQAKLYRHLGFVPFGPRVGTDDAPFQPMYITYEGFEGGVRSGVLAAPRAGELPARAGAALARCPHRVRAAARLPPR